MRIIDLLFLSTLLCMMALSCAHRSQSPTTTPATDPMALLAAKVVRISEEYANINTDLSGAEMSKHGIVDQTVFTAKFKDQTIRALLGKNYSDVPKGDWVGLIEEDGNLQLAISFGHAATDIGCAVGDTLYIEPLKP